MPELLKYRAVLNDPGAANQERPVQIITSTRADVDQWAALKLAAAVSDAAIVIVYLTVEQKIDILTKKGKPE